MSHVHLGVDSTDSLTEGMCTTYVGAAIAERLLKKGATFTDYPNLIRLNPNIPFKTRGNGSVVLRIDVPKSEIDSVFTIAEEIVEKFAIFSDPQTNPGIALYEGEVPDTLYKFYEMALHRLLTVEDACIAAKKAGARIHGYKNRMGIIGALAGIGETLQHDHTYELLVYRKKEKWGEKRAINTKTVIAMDKKLEDVFFNYDYQENTICIAPHSVCPVLAGIRGETPQAVRHAAALIDFGEPVSTSVIFRTNQHTNFHFEKVSSVSEIVDYSSVIVEGEVAELPSTIRGGHVFFELENNGRIQCAAFEPTKRLRDIVRNLVIGDHLKVYGGVKYGGRDCVRTINLERLDIINLKTSVYLNPKCPQCGKSMSSKGKGKGFECKKCKLKKMNKEPVKMNRTLLPGAYEPPPSAWRHLYKMIGRTKTNCTKEIALIDGWIENPLEC
jgi:tRNA(Ile2)-agmatinylcytidine synthase